MPTETGPTEVPFGDWMPDLPAINNPGSRLIENCLPRARSYSDFKGLQSFSNALDGACKGAFWARAGDEQIYRFAGDSDKLYALTGGTTWGDVSKAATTYSAIFWDFIAVNDRIIASDGGASALQYYDMGTSSTFDDLPGNPPKFKTLARIGDFVVGGNWTFNGDEEPGGIAHSGFNNTEIWEPALATQSNRIPSQGDGGQVQRIVPGDYGIAIKERACTLISYVGPPTVFDLDEVIVNHGTLAPRSVCWTRQYVFYYSTEGFMRMNRASPADVENIGAGRVNYWFLDEIAANDISNIVGAVDRSQGLVFWAFRSSISETNYNRIICYNWVFDRWSYAKITTQFIAESASSSITLDGLDAAIGSGGIDVNSIPVDSDAYRGGALTLQAFDSSNRASTFAGAPLVALMETAEMTRPGQRSYVNSVRPIVEGAPTSVEAAIVTRALPTANAVVGDFRTRNTIGEINVRANSRHMRFRQRIIGGFDHCDHLEVNVKQKGRR